MLPRELKAMLRALLALASTVLVVPALLAAWLLAAGSLVLDPLLPYLPEAVAWSATPWRIHLGGLSFHWGGEPRQFFIRVRDLEVREQSGRMLVELPEADVDLSIDALVGGMIAPTRIAVGGLTITLEHGFDGRIGLAGIARDEVAEEEDGAGIAAILADFRAAPDRARPTGWLREVRFGGSTLTLLDRPSGARWVARESDLTLTRRDDGIEFGLALALEFGNQRVPVRGQGSYRSGGKTAAVALEFEGLSTAALADRVPLLADLAALDTRLDGRIEIGLGEDGALAPIGFGLRAASGSFRHAQLAPKPLAIRDLVAEGRYHVSPPILDLSRFRLDTQGPSIEGRAFVADAPGSPAMAVDARFGGLRLDALSVYWPAGFANEARDWVLENVPQGMVDRGHFALHLDPGDLKASRLPEGAVRLDFDFSGARAHYLRPLPPIVEGRGHARITETAFELTLVEGRVDELQAHQGHVRIVGLDRDEPQAVIGVTVEGAIARQLWVIDHPPLELPRSLGLDPTRIGGRAATRVQLDFPLRATLGHEDVHAQVESRVEGASVPKAFANMDVTRADIVLRADNYGLEVDGRAAINGVPAEVHWSEVFEPIDGITSRYRLAMRTDDRQRRALGIDFGDQVRGPIMARASARMNGDALVDAELALDLTATNLDLRLPTWRKAAGESAGATVAVVGENGVLRLTRIEIDSPGVSVHAVGELQGLEKLRFLKVARFRQGETDVQAMIEATESGGYAVGIKGTALDLRPHLAALLTPSESGQPPLPELDIDLSIGRVLLGPGDPVRHVEMTAHYRGERLTMLAAEAGLGTAPLRISLRAGDRPQTRVLSVASADAGALYKALDISGQIRGGHMAIEVTIDDRAPDAPSQGKAVIEDFYLIDLPVAAQLLSVASLTGLADTLRGDGIFFKRFESEFTATSKQVALRNTAAAGPALGVTVEGTVNREAGTLDLRGTLSPAYTLNAALGNIPVIGRLFAARPGEGLVGLNYAIKGPAAEPSVAVNPLSVLTPGFLRRIFNIFSDEPPPP
ncbi:MAG: DUF3971 domain-containing protein [Alphaproteobacteria bacterium]|nr:DUF3971 domain-containing protein [Alphaproteobacteria bacterium]